MTQTVQKTQIKLLKAYKELFNPNWRYLVFYGGRNSGKSYTVGQSLLIRGRQEKLRILCTREVQNTIKDSVHKLLKDIIDKYEFTDYEVTGDAIRNTITGTEFIFKGLKYNIQEIKSTEGIDVCWAEEAQTISKSSIDILTPTIRKEGSQIIFTFNRVNELDPVFEHFVLNKPPNTFVKKVNYDILETAGLLNDTIRAEIDADRGDPDLFAHKWLGEPISQSDKAIISRQVILKAMNQQVPDDGAVEIGVDVARMGDDRTVICKRKGLCTKDYKVYTKLRTTDICDRIELVAEYDKTVTIKIDDTGVGGGVTDEMMARGYNVVAINFGGQAYDTDKYPNWISEAWFYMATILPQAELPMNSDLLMELSTRNWTQDHRGKRRVESKMEYKKRGFRSPDLADAFIICFYNEPLITMDDISL
jgi:phage terminase large subunit